MLTRASLFYPQIGCIDSALSSVVFLLPPSLELELESGY